MAKNLRYIIAASAIGLAGLAAHLFYKKSSDYNIQKPAILSSTSTNKNAEINNANYFNLSDFIKTNKYVLSYTENYVADSIGTLVHIRQEHALPIVRFNKVRSNIRQRIKNIQINIDKIISEYAKLNGSAAVMLEGYTDRTDFQFIKLGLMLDETLGILDQIPGPSEPFTPRALPPIPLLFGSEEDNQKYNKELEEYKKKEDEYDGKIKAQEEKAKQRASVFEEEQWYKWGAKKSLIQNTNIQFFPSTSYELDERSRSRLIEIIKTSKKEEIGKNILADSIITSERENEAIEFAYKTLKSRSSSNQTQNSCSDIFIIYGSAHNFTDNIQSWNSKNPDKKLSLITITPKGCKETEENTEVNIYR